MQLFAVLRICQTIFDLFGLQDCFVFTCLNFLFYIILLYIAIIIYVLKLPMEIIKIALKLYKTLDCRFRGDDTLCVKS